MDVETVRAKMMAQVEQARQSALARVFRWSFEIDGLAVYVAMAHRRRTEHTYLLRVAFEEFPRRAPSYVFLGRKTREITPDAWPPGVKHSDSPPGICTPGTREFHENYHANDAQYPWDQEKYTFLSTLQMIHKLMEHGIGG